ncbi:hypothetical protein E2I00_005066 [Balaenoptera physalus]|uniref:Sterol regulatory element-binding protein cleavage-activating protein n=1 Tax=Balaenoptera physalus TaxID=9770 RepID=A0A643CCQ7_BALPH|nr:hypothetical protein E2I00_005066 [Balaenoptera physalus]
MVSIVSAVQQQQFVVTLTESSTFRLRLDISVVVASALNLSPLSAHSSGFPTIIVTPFYPLLKLPLPGTGPVEFTTPVKDYSPPPVASDHKPEEPNEQPEWYVGAPVAYIQQIFVKSSVSPWHKNLLAVDVFRSPLSRAFQLVEEIRNHVLRDSSGTRSLEEVCLQVTDLLPGLRKLRNLLPEHGCLLLSPGNFWQNDREHFHADPDIIGTIHQHEPKTLQTSATLKESLVHVHFKEEIGIAELIPLVTTYIILFAYIYFSTRKIDMVKSKWGLALAAVVTVLSSLLMSIFPYLVVVIGLENVLVLTKSVVSTPVDLEVKLRIAQGLSNESWSIMKNMATELGIILIGYFTLVPAIQEFCLFAVVGLVSDFFLQMLFFTTVLSIDIRRMELADLNKRLPPEACLPPAKPAGQPARFERQLAVRPSTPHTITLQPSSFRNLRLPKRLRVVYFLARTRLAQRLIMAGTVVWIGILVYTDPAGLRTYLTAQVTEQSPLGEGALASMPVPSGVLPASHPDPAFSIFPPGASKLPENQTLPGELPEPGAPAEGVHDSPAPEVTWGTEDEELWRKLSFRHWPTLFSYYNITLAKSADGSIWSLELQGSLIVVGRSSGRLEVWDAIEGTLRCSSEEVSSGITALVFLDKRIVAARLNGSLDFFSLETHTALSPLQFRGAPGRGSSPTSPVYSSSDAVACHLTHTVPCAHQKPITALKAAAGRLVTGSQDHTLRVYRLEDSCCLFTLQGHSGAITTVYIDQTMVLASGGQDGAICLWDVLTGSRDLGCGASLGVISDNLLVTGGQGCVSFWDLNYGDLLQTVYLGKNSEAQPARQILVLDNAAIVCNFGSELSLVYVPSVLEKLD